MFARKGLAGTRLEEIATRTSTSKRMIYYYFGGKDGLYREVLADAYRRIRRAEEALDLHDLDPVSALRELAEFTFENHAAQQDFIRLVMIENVHEGGHMPDTEEMSGENVSAIRLLEDIYARGRALGLFREGLTAVELHWHISALSYFNVSNRATFSHIFGGELFGQEGQLRLRRHVGEMVVRFALRDQQSPT
jgi:AcrR family transcriptional regulator